MRQRLPRLRLFALASVFLAAACGDTAAPRTASQISVVSGGGQSAAVTNALPAPVVVQVNDQDGKPLGGATVSWSVTGDGGTVSAASSTTDNAGRAQVTWTLGTSAGAKQLSASAGSVSTVVTATANAGPAAAIGTVDGNPQTGVAGQPLGAPIVVRVTDAHGNPKPAATVTFTPAAGAGTVSPASVQTNAEGRAQTSWTLGAQAGEQTITVRVNGLASAVGFGVTATPGAAAMLDRVTPVEATGVVAASTPLVVKVTDSHGNGVAGTSVQFAVTGGGGAVTPSTVTSGADGQATAMWTLGTTAGEQTAIANAPSLGGAGLTFKVNAGAAQLATVALATDSVGTQVGDTVRAMVSGRDQYGNSATLPTLTWTTSAAAVATVDQTGLVRAVGAGTATITANVPTMPGVNASMKVTVAPTAAALNLTIGGLPDGALANVVVRGPNNFSKAVSASGVVGLPAAGEYTIEANEIFHTVWVYGAFPASQTFTAAAGETIARTVGYGQKFTQIQNDVPVTGISSPEDIYRVYKLTVPTGASSLTVTTTGSNGDVDVYVRRNSVPEGSTHDCYSALDGSNESCTVQAPQQGEWYILLNAWAAYTDVTLRATYVMGGNLTLQSSGLPSGAAGSFRIVRPNGFELEVAGDTTLSVLTPGTYTVMANGVAFDGKAYTPAPDSQQVAVQSGQTTTVSVNYAETAGGFNLDIAGMYITQATQTMTGAVPLVADRDGLLRVFVRGSLANTSIPDVRVVISRNNQVIETRTIAAPSSATPISIDEGVLVSSWNYRIPGSMIQPGLQLVAEVDPDNTVEESNETDNLFPSNGTPLTMDVRTVEPFRVTLVPVIQPNGLTGDVTEANKNTYTDFAHALYPLAAIDAQVRAPFTFNKNMSPSYDDSWQELLAEMLTLRNLDASTRNYYGVLKPGYTSGGTGLGYIGFPVAIGIDWNTGPSGSTFTYREITAAHEWGHNFGRNHVGCGNPSNPDANYPYAGGALGLHGWDMRTNELKLTSSHFDLMSYCLPYWSSDYTYNAVLNFRSAAGGSTAAVQPSLLVWGRTTADGRVILEPAFEVNARPTLPERSGRYRLQALDATGATLFDMSFDGYEVDHMEGVRHFAYTIPLSRLRGREAAVLRVTGGAADAVQRKAPPVAMAEGAMDDVTVSREGSGMVRLKWDATRSPVVLVRDPQTGDVLSFARGGNQLIAVNGTELELNMTDGVSSTKRRMRVQR